MYGRVDRASANVKRVDVGNSVDHCCDRHDLEDLAGDDLALSPARTIRSPRLAVMLASNDTGSGLPERRAGRRRRRA